MAGPGLSPTNRPARPEIGAAVTAGDDVQPLPGDGVPGEGVRRGRTPRGGTPAGGTGPAGNPGPWLVADPDVTSGTGLILFPQPGALPAVWAGPVPGGGLEP